MVQEQEQEHTCPTRKPTLSLAVRGRVKNAGNSIATRTAAASVTPSYSQPIGPSREEREAHEGTHVANGPHTTGHTWASVFMVAGALFSV